MTTTSELRSKVDGVVTEPLVEASDERDLSTDGGGHRSGGNFTGQPIMEDVISTSSSVSALARGPMA